MAGVLVGVMVFVALAAAAIWLMQRANAEPAARAAEEAPDPAEEEAARRSTVRRSSILAERERD
jgi:uncharacterized iron-regulated membrane protein